MAGSFARRRGLRVTAAGAVAGIALCMVGGPAKAQLAGEPLALAAVPATSTVDNSALDAQLFYQLVVGELELRAGSPGTAFQIILDAARKERNEELFKRAADIALQARAGDQSLVAARAWRSALPKSIEAHRYVIQLLVALGKSNETREPLKSLIGLTAAADRPALINSLPRFFVNASDKKAIAPLLEEVLADFSDDPVTRLAALQALAGAWLIAEEPMTALTLARRARDLDPSSERTALLALQLLPTVPEAESLVTGFFEVQPENVNIRVLYARVLGGAQRFTDAIAQLERITRTAPDRATPWLTLGALQLELRMSREATASLERFLALSGAAPVDTSSDDDDTDNSIDQARIQAWLMLAQAAEQVGNFKAAEAWLARADNPQRALEVQQRRASLLAKQGKVAEARALIRQLPERDADASRAKVFAESQLLRDAKLWKEADAVLARGLEQSRDDVDMLYEKSMLAEKLDNMPEMERLLRRVIELKPKHHHAHNALGYSFAERNTRLPEAKQLIEKALELAPGDPFITDSLGWVEYRLGNLQESIRLLRKAYQMRPDTEIGAHLGEVLWVSGQTEEARRIWREVRGRDAGNDVLRETLARLRANL